jgi:hypothetical protein
MKAEQIGRPYILSSHWVHIQKAVSGLLMPSAQYKSHPYLLHINHHVTSNPSFSESITTHAATAVVTAPLFPDKIKIACKYLLFFILNINFTHQSFPKQFRLKNFKNILLNRDELLLQTVWT